MIRFGALLSLIFLVTSCTERITNSVKDPIDIPSHFESPIYPSDNIPTKEKIELGEKLFFDTQLSKNKNISCASCHQTEFAFTDNQKTSVGTNNLLGFRNAPSLINVAYKTIFHMDGGVRTLELQALAPLIDTNEMAGDFVQILSYLQSDSTYIKLFEKAFDTVPTIFGLTRAIASFERSLIQGNSPYDQFINGDSNALSAPQKKGLALFNSSRLNCKACHNGINLTNYTFQNIGLAHQYVDSGRARITYKPEDAGKFMVPSLRNITLTSPYMHDGSVKTLIEVLEYLETGGGPHPNKNSLIAPFKLNDKERSDLLSFFDSLADTTYN